MRKVIKEYDVYKFNELSQEIQERELEESMRIEYDQYCEWFLEEDMSNEGTELLREYYEGATFKQVHYDLSYSQGSGSMIEFDIDLEDINNKYKYLTNEEIKELKNFGGTNVKVYHHDNYYCHEYTYSVDYNDFSCFDYDWEHIDNIEKVQDRIIEMIQTFEKDIISMNKELTKRGYALLENKEYFEERARETLNELEFLSDGRVFNE